MPTEKEKMLAGELYDPGDPELKSDRARARAICQRLNSLSPGATQAKARLLEALLGAGVSIKINTPFFCDYGYNQRLGSNVYFNVNCVLLDVMPISIGNDVLIGPGVHLYTACHPLSAKQRKTGLEFGRPITIEDDVWIGGGAIVCPGVRIGAGAVIGAGSVVTRDVPSGVLAAGNPCRVIRRVTENE